MTRILIFCSTLLFLSCSPTKKSTPPVDLISKLETVIFDASVSHDYFKILSEIDSTERVDLIPDLKRIDSLIVQEWIIPISKTLPIRNNTPPFYIELREKLSNTIFSLVLAQNGCVTNEEKYIHTLSNLNKNYVRTNYPIRPGYSFLESNIDIFAPFIKSSFLDNDALNIDNFFLISIFEKGIKQYGSENTKKIMAKQIIDILKNSEQQKFDTLFSCKLIYLLGMSKSNIAKDYFIEFEGKEQSVKIRDCMILTLKYWFDVDIENIN